MQNPPSTMRRSSRPRALALLVCSALLLASEARAAGTSPVLALTTAGASAAGNGDRVLFAEGAFNFEDLVQIPFPAAGLMVVQGSRLVRYEVDGAMVEATSAAVTNGVTPDELPALLALTGTPAGPARLVRIASNGVSVVLPSDIASGSALVFLYAHHDTEYFVSNAIPVVLP